MNEACDSLLELVWLKASNWLLEDSDILRTLGGLECLIKSLICMSRLFVVDGGGVFLLSDSGLCRDFRMVSDFFGLCPFLLCRLMFGLRFELDGLRDEAMSVLLEAPPSVTIRS